MTKWLIFLIVLLIWLCYSVLLRRSRPKAKRVKRMRISEFRSEGYLQEANRQFFHPLGLALEVVLNKDGTEKLGGVWDYRDDPEGLFFDGVLEPDKTNHIRQLVRDRIPARFEALGYWLQPVEEGDEE